MLTSGSLLDPVLINTIGHTAGVLLFGLFTVLLIRDWRAHGIRHIKLSLMAALLALGWNVGSLVVLASNNTNSEWIRVVMETSFSLLSLLPAVLLEVVLQGKQPFIVKAGYTVSTLAVALHFGEFISSGDRGHQFALSAIAIGFGVLTCTAFVLRRRNRQTDAAGRSEWISLACLLLFTTSFLHFGYEHVRSPWTAEVAWHHLGIPVALIVLLQDYSFLLLDTFIRFVINSALAAAYIVGVLLLDDKFHLWEAIAHSIFLTGIALVALCLSLIGFAYFRNGLQVWVSRFVFRRQSVDESAKAIAKLAAAARSEDDLLRPAAAEVARHFSAGGFRLVSGSTTFTPALKPSILFPEREPDDSLPPQFHGAAQIPLRFSSGDTRLLVLGPRRGGRRYLSEDLEEMRVLGAAVVEQMERLRAAELKRLIGEAELRALQAQINPHFLFNALNTLYGTIDRTSIAARRLVLNLADIFRYFLQTNRSMIPLSEELRIVEAYLEIETARLGDRLEKEIAVNDSLRDALIPVLCLQPLVENAVKHGVAPKPGRGRVSVRAEQTGDGLRFVVEDSGYGFEQSLEENRKGRQNGSGVGLDNVRRRLALCYGPAVRLEIQSSAAGSKVAFTIPQSTGTIEKRLEMECAL